MQLLAGDAALVCHQQRELTQAGLCSPLTPALSLTRRPLCGRPEVLAVPAGVPVRVHRGRGDRRRGEHR